MFIINFYELGIFVLIIESFIETLYRAGRAPPPALERFPLNVLAENAISFLYKCLAYELTLEAPPEAFA